MSLPTWECGLKLGVVNHSARSLGSLPTWECGLKHYDIITFRALRGCHSLRGSVD